MKTRMLIPAYAMLAAICLMVAPALAQDAQNFPKVREFRLQMAMPEQAVACIECHKQETPGIFADWANSGHAKSGITCLDCHQAQPSDPDVSRAHFEYYANKDMPYSEERYRIPVAAVVTPKDCSRCHPDQAEQYAKSKHANTLEIIWKIDYWLNDGMNNEIERKTGCFACHGTVLKTDAKGNLTPDTWPNVGVGRLNLDGSLGSCTSCHTRHAFSPSEARKPEACGQCHLGPDHPQIEIYTESKHGAIYATDGASYNWSAAPGMWTPGVDYRAPTCASCHMSGVGVVPGTHDVTERLAWESQAPLTIRPSEFKPFPAKTDWQAERAKMKAVCLQCHSKVWTDDHFASSDKAIENYNEVYFKPAKARLDELYARKLLTEKPFFDESLEWEFYELWHHEGRRARMGAQMMAPDYSWWHGFYECKHRFVEFMEASHKLLESGKPAYRYPDFPGAGGSTKKPEAIFGKN